MLLGEEGTTEQHFQGIYLKMTQVKANLAVTGVQGYLALKKHPPPRTLQQDYT